jgi:hypothetical protein
MVPQRKLHQSRGEKIAMYAPDLTPYTYTMQAVGPGLTALNVGWLDKDHPFEVGFVEPEVVQRIFHLCEIPVRQTRGFHLCPFCKERKRVVVKIGGTELFLGSAEIRVQDRAGVVFAAPNLIYHYITAHNYRPPEEFLSAVRGLSLLTHCES